MSIFNQFEGTFTFGILVMDSNDENQGIPLSSFPGIIVPYRINIFRTKARLIIAPFTIQLPDNNYIVTINGFIPPEYSPTSARYINFEPIMGVFGHVFRDGTVRFSGSLNMPLSAGNYNIPMSTVKYSLRRLNLPSVNNFPIAQGLTNATVNEGIFDQPPDQGGIDNLEYFTVVYQHGKIYAAWGDNSPQIKSQAPEITDPYTDIAFAVLDEQGNYLITPRNVSRLPGAEMEVSLAVNPLNPLILNMASWAVENNQNFKAFYAYSEDGGLTWTRVNLFQEEIIPPLQTGSFTGDHKLLYDKFGNLFYVSLGGYYLQRPFIFDNLVPLADINYSSDGGKTFFHILLALPNHIDAVGLDYPQVTISEEPDGSSVFWLVIKQLKDLNEAFETGNSFNQIAYAIKMKGLHVFDGIRFIELPTTINGGYGGTASGFNGLGKEIVSLGIPVKGSFGSLKKSNSSIWFSYNPIGFFGEFLPIRFFANTNSGYRETYPPQPHRELWSQPNIAIDNNNRWYVVYLDEPASIVQPTRHADIWLIYSDDLGLTWSTPFKVNNDNTPNTHFQPQIKVDRDTNNLLIAWLDTRDDPNDILLRPFAAVIPNGFFPRLKKTSPDQSSASLTDFFNC